MYGSVFELVDDADVVDHDELQQAGDVEQPNIEGEAKLEYLHEDHHHQIGERTKNNPEDDAGEGNENKELADNKEHIVNIRFYLQRL